MHNSNTDKGNNKDIPPDFFIRINKNTKTQQRNHKKESKISKTGNYPLKML